MHSQVEVAPLLRGHPHQTIISTESLISMSFGCGMQRRRRWSHSLRLHRRCCRGERAFGTRTRGQLRRDSLTKRQIAARFQPLAAELNYLKQHLLHHGGGGDNNSYRIGGAAAARRRRRVTVEAKLEDVMAAAATVWWRRRHRRPLLLMRATPREKLL